MRLFLRTSAALAFGLLLLPRTAEADTTDMSLAKEVDNYLEEATGGADDPTTFRFFWKTGIRAETADGVFKIQIFGRLMWDNRWEDSDDVGTVDTSFFRRVRLGVSGEVYKHTLFKIQIDFAGGEENAPDLKDVYLGLKSIGFLGKMLAGHFKEPFGLEELTSSKYIFFMERSAPTSAFSPSRNNGIMFTNTVGEKKMFMWAAGIFRDEADDTGIVTENGGYNLTLRVAAWFWEDKEAGRILHVGFGFSYRDPNGESARFRARPGTGTGDRFVDTGTLSADELILFNFELALVWKSFFAALEFFAADVTAVGAGPEPMFTGWYVMLGWWITGETTNYSKSKFTFDRARVDSLFHDAPGTGAWQVVFRYDTIDLTDEGITGGEQDTYTFGVNWHWNRNTRMMFDVVFADADPSAGGGPQIEATYFQTRFQFDF